MLAPITAPKPIIYLAGKIGHDDWRTQIFGSRFGSVDWADDDATSGFKKLLDETLTTDCGRFLYGGPFFIACDHSCAHAPNGHGASPSGCLTGNAPYGRLEILNEIWRVNCARIKRADFIFAYINETDCYGTLIELGYAAALDKNIGVGIGRNIKVEEFDDLWMARQCHRYGSPWLGSPAETFHEFLDLVMHQYRAPPQRRVA
jgi:hypothetical protein